MSGPNVRERVATLLSENFTESTMTGVPVPIPVEEMLPMADALLAVLPPLLSEAEARALLLATTIWIDTFDGDEAALRSARVKLEAVKAGA